MTDNSTGIKKAAKGDATLLRPTVTSAVPLILDRIRKTVTTRIDSRGDLLKSMFYFLLDYKTFWRKNGFDTPIVNFLICRRVQRLFGGRLQYIVSGSAPISPDTHDFIRSCFNVKLAQGYGLTETAAGATVMDFNDWSVGRVGPPLFGLKIKLQDWPEGKYSIHDKPNPRGEIVIGGDCVAAGYYKNNELTNEYFKDEDGERWFLTGDIGEIHTDGCLKVIDRKKDLVKLQLGEYVSLAKVEAGLSNSELVDNVCVYANPKQKYVVALIVPNPKALSDLAKALGKNNLSHKQLCDDFQVNEVVLKIIVDNGIKSRLQKFELPRKVTLVKDIWTPENGFVTAAFKLKRRNLEHKYKLDIERMYAD
ncbi:Long-chain-fatty-acid--CoA ligase 3-like protein [Leptotrombidium deliense]|uniref:long-chain-fatty-acid--CoA ligase n=1 Tax=Leptotrombidium deliense TaxID=299467 RepID=A0A443S5Z7_9ACAR|nr:Long-chain-fatty-acid--CoA ligase 3-like protein [Leptotrombidium deliense]